MAGRILQRRLGVAPLALLTLIGCGSAGGEAANKDINHVRAVTTLYFRAASVLGKRPETEQEFKQAIAGGKMDLSVLGVDSVDELFVSDRDGQPIVVVYGSALKSVAPGVVAYEQTGKDGMRLVGFNNGQVEEADQTRFAQLVPDS